MDFAKIAADLEWLKQHPWFAEKPASVAEFLGEGYLEVENKTRSGLRLELIELFGEEPNGFRIARYQWAMFTGAIGIGKTTMASLAIPYMTHWVLCLKNPQDFYDFMPGSRIAFMQMSTSSSQAEDVVFGDIKARIEYSPWFQSNYPFDPNYKKELHFAKDIWIIPGNSSETTFEGYNILGGILDEADSHKTTEHKDYAEQGYDTINSRIDSRFDDRGFLMVIGQMKKASGFAKRKYDELSKNPKAHTIRMTIWESFGWQKYLKADGTKDSFWYDIKRKEIVPTPAAVMLGKESNSLMEIPRIYIENFRNNPEKALRDLAGIPPAAGDPFISLTYKIEEARDRWIERYNVDSPVTESSDRPVFKDWFMANDSLKRAAHLDVAYSADGDALGLSMGHVSHMVEIEGEHKPYIVFDFLLRVKAAPGTEIFLQEIRRLIYQLKDERRFRLKMVSMDGFQSTDTRQQLQKRRFQVLPLSVDKSKLPYEDLRDAIYEDRIEFPPYLTYLNKGDMHLVEIAVKELMELEEGDKKIDHPVGGSKDVADTMAGVTTSLMGDRSYRRKLSSQEILEHARQNVDNAGDYRIGRHVMPGMPGGLQAPLPPTQTGFGDLSMPIPPRLIPRGDR